MNETVPSRPLLLSLLKHFTRGWLAFRYRILSRRYRRLVIEQIDDMFLIILPTVFNPILLRTGELLARAMETTPLLDHNNNHSPLVLDLGSGSGIGAIFAASRGARVVATDLNQDAVRCVRLNALLNGFEDKIEARFGDLFEPVGDQRFDLILFNPPFYRGRPKDSLDMAWRGEKIFERFAAELKDHLTPSGCSFLVLSTDGEYQVALNELKRNNFAVTPSLQRDFGNEIITVYKVTSFNGFGSL